MFVPLYNHADEDGSTYLRSFGVRPADDTPFVPNFLIGWLDIQRFHQAHEFLAEPFKRRYGYGFWEFLVTLYGLGLIILLSPRLGMLSRDPFQGYFEPYGQGLRLFINALRRGQEFVAMSGDHLADMVWQRIRGLPNSRATTVDDIRKCLGDLTLTPDKHHQIRLWSGGRQFPVIPFDGGYLIDGQGLVSLLRTMFVDVQFDQGPRGPVFERAFRLALAEAGFPAEKSGRIRTHSGEMREIDASVRIGGELILFECRAMARPLLYDLGKPSVLRKRTEDLANKVKQVASLRDFIRRNPRGRNYNFEWAQAISTFVVSPFVEWLWDTSSELWHDGTMPRILQADAALSYLRQRRGEQKVSQPDNA